MANSSSSFSSFAKTILLPLLLAAALYLFLFYALLPLYRRYRANIARYSQYAPLASTVQNTTSLFSPYIPEALRPKTLRERLSSVLMRFLIPSTWAFRNRSADGQTVNRRDSFLSDDGDAGLFDEESGERMIGFDVNEGRRAVDGLRRSDGFGIRDGGEDAAIVDSNRRLSRDLEEGFRDDSASEASDEEPTVGRRRASMARDSR